MRWWMGNFKVEHEGLCKNLLILSSELPVPGVGGTYIERFFVLSTQAAPHRTFLEGEFSFVLRALRGRPAEWWLRYLHLWREQHFIARADAGHSRLPQAGVGVRILPGLRNLHQFSRPGLRGSLGSVSYYYVFSGKLLKTCLISKIFTVGLLQATITTTTK